MKKFSSIVSLAAGVVLASQAHASLITGDISFSGTATLDSAIASSTAIASLSNVTVGTDTQSADYLGTDGAPVTFNSLTFLSGGAPAPIVGTPTLWTFTSGVKTYEFKLSSLTSVTKDANHGITTLSIWGSGVAQITGFTDTPGQFSLVLTGKKTSVTFAAYSIAVSKVTPPIPEPSSWALMSGLGLVGFAWVRRMRQ